MTAFGVECLVFSEFVTGLQPVPASAIHALPWAWVNGVFLILAGLSLLVKPTARIGALSLAGLFLLSVLLFHLPLLVANLAFQADDSFHALAVVAGALILAAQSSESRGAWDRLLDRGGQLGRIGFGLCSIGHGAMHFVFLKFTADFIPAWIPQHEFWAAATGVAQIAAGLAILGRVLARPAAILLGVMYGSWVLIVHLPRVMASPTSHIEWTSIFIALSLSATALLVGGYCNETQ
jgi:uncharacterized membrane protein YphA (DoxX/SURF4 family)